MARLTTRTRATFDTVRRIGLQLPEVTPSLHFGAPALKLRGEMFVCVPSHRSAEADSLAVRMDFDRRDALIAAAPDTYYVKEHYEGYPCVLVRLKRVDEDALRDLLLVGWRFVDGKQRAHKRRPRIRRAGRVRRPRT